MANEVKKYVSLERLETFKENIDETFATKTSVDKKLDASKYVVDDTLSPTSTNPIQNKVIDAELDAIANAMGALEQAVDGKANEIHSHELSDISGLTELQSDWSVNDPADPAYVQNRTHWMSVDRVTWFNNETMTFEAFNGAYNTQIVIDEPILDVGHTYTFVIDNTTFESEAYEFEGMVCLGNLSILDSSLTNTNELFLACSPLRDGVGGADGNFIMIATSLEGTSHTIAISADVTTYHKIDEKYLPQLIGRAGERVGSEIFNDYENNFAGGAYAHAEGHSTWASGYASHAEGEGAQATFENAHAEGCETIASGSNSHAEGNKTTASNYNAHAEGNTTIASGHSSHAEGVRTEASGQGAHAEGQNTKASAWHSHTAGQGTEAAGRSQYVFGEYNIVDDTASGVSQRGTYIHIVGNGNSVNAKSNAHTLDWSGNAWFAGEVKVGGTGQDDGAASKLATESYVDATAMPRKVLTGTDENPAVIVELGMGVYELPAGTTYSYYRNNDTYTTNGSFIIIYRADEYIVAGVEMSADWSYGVADIYLNVGDPDNAWNSFGTGYVSGYHGEDNFGRIMRVGMGGYVESGFDYVYCFNNDRNIPLVLSNLEEKCGAATYLKLEGCFKVYPEDENIVQLGEGQVTAIYDRESFTVRNVILFYNDKIVQYHIDLNTDEKYVKYEYVTKSYVEALIDSIKPKSTTVTLRAANWTGDINPWSQVVSINGVTENSKVDLQPTAQQIVVLQDAEVSIMFQNDSGTVTAWAIGKKPTVDYTFDVLITEVNIV